MAVKEDARFAGKAWRARPAGWFAGRSWRLALKGRGVKIFLLSADEVILSGVTLVWLSTDCTAAGGKPNAMHARHVGY